jgi:hypothetical protein
MKQHLFSLCMILSLAGEAAWGGLTEDTWKQLDSSEASTRDEARAVFEKTPVDQWLERALVEHRSWAALELMEALCTKLPPARFGVVAPHLCEQLMTLRIESMDPAQQQAAIAMSRKLLEKLRPHGADQRAQLIDVWTSVAANVQLQGPVRTQVLKLIEWMQGVGNGSVK